MILDDLIGGMPLKTQVSLFVLNNAELQGQTICLCFDGTRPTATSKPISSGHAFEGMERII
jgi:hypothetical protein